MKCPNCSAQSGDDALECASCGVVFANWRARQEREKTAAAAALAALEAPAAEPPLNPWIVRGAASAFVAFWMLGLGMYFLRHPAKRRPAPGADTGSYVELRDPKTGELRRMPILRMAGAPAPPGAPAEAPAPDERPVPAKPTGGAPELAPVLPSSER